MDIKIPTVVVTLLLQIGLTTCSLLSTGDGKISATTPQDGGTITSTMFQESRNISTDSLQSTSERNTRSTISNTTISPVNSPQPITDRPASEPSTTTGIRVLYRMTSTFLDVIQPPGKNLYDELHMESALAATPNRPFEAVAQSLSSKASSDPKYFVRYWAGFAVCLAFGAVFVVVLPLVGLIVCLCRCCCHRCGHEKTGTPEKTRDRPIRICLGIFLFLLTIVILAGTVCAFMSNELVRQQTASSNGAQKDGGGGGGGGETGGGLLSTIVRNLGEVDAFKEATVKEVEGLLVQVNSTLLTILYKAIDKLKEFPEMASDRLREDIGSDLIGNISTLNHTLVQLVEALRVVDADSKQLQNLYLELNQSLTTIENNVTNLCKIDRTTNCSSPGLTRGLSDTNQMPNINSQLTALESIVSQGINISVFEDISGRIRKELQPVLDGVSNFDISDTVKSISSSIKSAADSFNLKSLVEAVNGTRADVDKYGSYRFNVCVAISALLLLIVFLIFVGLCIGVFSKPPYDVDSTAGVTRWTASQFLMASVVIMFLFCSVLMIIVSVLFVSGGIIYTDGCRGIDQQQDNALVKIADSLLRTQLGNVSFYGVMRDCKNNDGIVKALNLDEKLHISDKFNLSNLIDLDSSKRTIDLSHFQLTGPKQILNNLRNSTLVNINFTAFNEMANETRLRSSLTESINSLNASAQNINETTVKKGLEEIVQQLQNLSETIVVEITNRTEHLRIALKELNDTLYVDNSTKKLTDFLADIATLLDRTENRTKTEASGILQQLLDEVASNVTSTVKEVINITRTHVLTGVGRCSPLSKAIESTVAAVCHSTLDPYNAFWFSYGWCVFLFIPTIAVAVVLAQLCWRLDVPPQSYSDVSGYDAYKSTYPEEYLRLHNLTTPQHVPKGQPDYVQGHSVNPGYIDYGDNDRTQGNGTSNPNNNGIDFYRGIGSHGNGSYDNPTYSDNDSNGYRIPRPTTAHARMNENNRF